MSYLNKYLKYKNKYFNLKTKIQGGYKPDLNTLNEMKKYVDDGTFTVHDFIVSQHYNNLQTFFNIIKDNIHLYIIPENFDNFLIISDFAFSSNNDRKYSIEFPSARLVAGIFSIFAIASLSLARLLSCLNF